MPETNRAQTEKGSNKKRSFVRAFDSFKNIVNALSRVFERVKYTYKKQGLRGAVSCLGKSVSRRIKLHRKSIKRYTKRLIPVTGALVVLLVSLNCWTSFTLALEVSYDGQPVGYAADESSFKAACHMIDERIVTSSFDDTRASCELKVVESDSISDANEICENIISVSDELTEAVGLVVDGEIFEVYSGRDVIENAFSELLSRYTTGASDESYSFANAIDYAEGLYDSEEICGSIDLEALSSRLTVMVTRTETVTEDIAYSTEEIGDSSKYIGYRNTVKSGVTGVKTKLVASSYINGELYKSEIVSEEVTKEPENAVVSVGTKLFSNASDTNTGTVYFWPVARVENSYVSAYYGDGRNHKGIDICAPYGTQIYAAESGTVVDVGSDSSYGLYFVIDHGDGYKTLYSHCSSISVSVGQEVSRGQYAAAVGMTGNATGYHLHFEVYVDGVRTNPAPYLGV